MLIKDWMKEYFTILKPMKTLNCKLKREKNIVKIMNVNPKKIFSLKIIKSGAQILKPAKNITDIKIVTAEIRVKEVLIKLFASFSGKKRITLISKPNRENMVIKLMAEMIAELMPISFGEYNLAAMIQKINPIAAVINVFPIK